jgi:hypothetical protein
MITLNDVFKIPGFVPDPERDRDYEKKSGETVSQVQGSIAFTQAFVQWTEENPDNWPDLRALSASSNETCRTNALILIAKTVGHIFPFAGKFPVAKGREYQFEGFNETFVIPRILCRWNAFAKAGLVSQEIHAFVAGALLNAFWHDNCSLEKAETASAQIQKLSCNDLPIVVGSGWVWHSTYVIFYKGLDDLEDEIRMAYCNRGRDCGTYPGTWFHKIKDKAKITPEFLLNLADRTKVENAQYKSLDKIKIELDASLINYIAGNPQKTGNCTYSNLKTALFTLLLMRESQINSNLSFPLQAERINPCLSKQAEDAKKLALKTYKAFFSYEAKEALSELCQHFSLREPLLAPLGYYKTLAERICQLAFCKKPNNAKFDSLEKTLQSIESCPLLDGIISAAKTISFAEHIVESIKMNAPLTPMHIINYSLKPITDFSLIKKLSLNRMNLDKLPIQIADFTQLVQLALFNNQFRCIPLEISRFTALQVLDLGSNQISEWLEEIEHMTNLTSLLLDANKISTFPLKIECLMNLKLLSLKNNQISEIPEMIGRLTTLESFSLTSNQIKAIPPAITSLTNLRSLALGKNRITSIPSELFQNCTRLENLYLENNQIKSLPSQLGNLTKLVYLTLQENELADIPLSLTQCSCLRLVQLKDNKITRVPDALRDFFAKHQLTPFK